MVINSKKINEIIIGQGAIERLSEKCREYFPAGRAFILTDSNIAPLWLEKTINRLKKDGISVFSYIFKAGENSKNKTTLFEILDEMQRLGLTRSDFLIALGGGVTGDMGALAAALYNRGIPVIQLPTTLLAMVDSSIGGKTGINTQYGKNLIGVFHQPAFVICDTDFLSTLPQTEITNGVAEIIKYGAVCDKEIFEALETGFEKCNAEEIIEKCVKIKTDIADKDETDKAIRFILNFGHTFGHAVEKLSGYTVPHGVAVAKGMVLAAEKSEKEGICPVGTAERIKNCCKVNLLDTACEYSMSELLSAAENDKKKTNEGLRFILLEEIGKAVIR